MAGGFGAEGGGNPRKAIGRAAPDRFTVKPGWLDAGTTDCCGTSPFCYQFFNWFNRECETSQNGINGSAALLGCRP
jgi:hypothetical protein